MSQEVELWGVPEGMVETEVGKKPGTKQGTQEMGVRGGEISFSEKMATEVFLCPRVLPAPCQKRGTVSSLLQLKWAFLCLHP